MTESMSDTERKKPFHWLRRIPGHRPGVRARGKSRNPDDRDDDPPVIRKGAVPPDPYDDIVCGYYLQTPPSKQK